MDTVYTVNMICVASNYRHAFNVLLITPQHRPKLEACLLSRLVLHALRSGSLSGTLAALALRLWRLITCGSW